MIKVEGDKGRSHILDLLCVKTVMSHDHRRRRCEWRKLGSTLASTTVKKTYCKHKEKNG